VSRRRRIVQESPECELARAVSLYQKRAVRPLRLFASFGLCVRVFLPQLVSQICQYPKGYASNGGAYAPQESGYIRVCFCSQYLGAVKLGKCACSLAGAWGAYSACCSVHALLCTPTYSSLPRHSFLSRGPSSKPVRCPLAGGCTGHCLHPLHLPYFSK
jgi:hypothetical protein